MKIGTPNYQITISKVEPRALKLWSLEAALFCLAALELRALELSFRSQGCSAVMPTGYGKRLIFQPFATAVLIKKVQKEQHSDTVVLATCSR